MQERLKLEVFEDIEIPETLPSTKSIVIEFQTSIKFFKKSPRVT